MSHGSIKSMTNHELTFDTFNARLFAPNHSYLKKFTDNDILSDIVIYIAKYCGV